ncbi:hypothetical protein PRVXT_001628 [Proteinivorax tanatarense]|uniref:Uncharacterized protein n=1 Tax=Proteinivorax tanatarense TaxID=1260629 RepID=A0AAU7VI36_9FIRM
MQLKVEVLIYLDTIKSLQGLVECKVSWAVRQASNIELYCEQLDIYIISF